MEYDIETEMAKLRSALRILRDDPDRTRKMLVKSQLFGQVGLGNIHPDLIPEMENLAADDFQALESVLETRYLTSESNT